MLDDDGTDQSDAVQEGHIPKSGLTKFMGVFAVRKKQSYNGIEYIQFNSVLIVLSMKIILLILLST